MESHSTTNTLFVVYFLSNMPHEYFYSYRIIMQDDIKNFDQIRRDAIDLLRLLNKRDDTARERVQKKGYQWKR